MHLKKKFISYVFFWVIPLRLNFICLTFGTLYFPSSYADRRKIVILHLSAYKDVTECSEAMACKIQMQGNYPEENTQHSEHGESLKSGTIILFFVHL
jgi:hypothetical protein